MFKRQITLRLSRSHDENPSCGQSGGFTLSPPSPVAWTHSINPHGLSFLPSNGDCISLTMAGACPTLPPKTRSLRIALAG